MKIFEGLIMSKAVRNSSISLVIIIICLIVIIGYVSVLFGDFSFLKHINPLQIILTKSAEELDEVLTNTISTYKFPKKLFIFGDEQYCNVNHTNGSMEYKYKYKSAMVGGLYNTGTNALLSLLSQNCFGKSKPLPQFSGMESLRYYHINKRRKIRKKVKYFHRFNYVSLYNITKHEAIPAMHQLIEKGIEYQSDYSSKELYIIIIKDPLTWIKSMCKASYYVVFGRLKWKKSALCPHNLHNMSANQWHAHVFDNILQLYNTYYSSWLGGNETVGIGTYSRNKALANMIGIDDESMINEKPPKRFYAQIQKFLNRFVKDEDFGVNVRESERFRDIQRLFEPVELPHIVIRFEDVLFRPSVVVDRVCECVGGYRKLNGTILQENAAKRHGKSKTRQQALDSYANETYRYLNYDQNDINFVKKEVNQTIMDLFRYTI